MAGWRSLLTGVRDGGTCRSPGGTEEFRRAIGFMAWSGGGGECRWRPLHALPLPVQVCVEHAPWPCGAPDRRDRDARLREVRKEPLAGAEDLQERFQAGNALWRNPRPGESPREDSFLLRCCDSGIAG